MKFLKFFTKPFFRRSKPKPTPNVDINQLNAFGLQPFVDVLLDGDKFDGGFGPTQIQTVDYVTLRMRSTQLFNDNLYAKGMIRRLVTNEINTGLLPEASPDENVIGLPEDSLSDWTEIVENRFILWGKTKQVCDWHGIRTFGALQKTARMEALIAGDVLVVMHNSRRLQVPQVQLISGASVQTPLAADYTIAKGNDIRHGVEVNANNIPVAYWIVQNDGTYKRLPAFARRTGRKIAWLLYGTERRLDDIRGQPILAIVLQSLKEIDRYRDSTQRKATINSILAMFIKKTEDKFGSLPMSGGAKRKATETIVDNAGEKRKFTIGKYLPGLVFDELQYGEEPVPIGGQGTDVNFAVFEEAIVQAIAWANEMPPEILRLAFSNNYSASQAAINEFKIYLNKIWSEFGDDFCQPIFVDWLISENLNGRFDRADILEAWRDQSEYATFAAWTYADWYGSIKPSTDMLKQVKASELLVNGGYSTRSREARIMTGTKYSKNIKRLIRENEQLVIARAPLVEQENMTGEGQNINDDRSSDSVRDNAMANFANNVVDIAEAAETLNDVIDKVG